MTKTNVIKPRAMSFTITKPNTKEMMEVTKPKLITTPRLK